MLSHLSVVMLEHLHKSDDWSLTGKLVPLEQALCRERHARTKHDGTSLLIL
jgi:hypothetical protein